MARLLNVPYSQRVAHLFVRMVRQQNQTILSNGNNTSFFISDKKYPILQEVQTQHKYMYSDFARNIQNMVIASYFTDHIVRLKIAAFPLTC